MYWNLIVLVLSLFSLIFWMFFNYTDLFMFIDYCKYKPGTKQAQIDLQNDSEGEVGDNRLFS